MKIKLSTFALGGLALIALLVEFNARSIGAKVLQAGWSIPAITSLHLGQLLLSACAWRLAVGDPSHTRMTFFRLRTIREGVNSLLPVAQIGGQVVCIRLMTQIGIGLPSAVAGTTLDLTLEAAMQLVFTLCGIAILPLVGVNAAWAAWAEGGLVLGFVGIVGFILAQRAGLLRLIEFLAARLNLMPPALAGGTDAAIGFHDELMRLQRKPWMLTKASALHLLSWLLGTGEVYLVLFAMGYPVGLAQAVIVESLGMAARSAGFAIPGALGVQEGGFILVCGLFGVPPDVAIALSVVKRLREILVGIPGLIMWQWSEIKHKLAARETT